MVVSSTKDYYTRLANRMTNIRIVRNKVDADEIPPYTTESVNESCSQPAQSLLNMTKNKE